MSRHNSILPALIGLFCGLMLAACTLQSPAPEATTTAETIAGLPVIGEAEYVILEPQGLRLAARIDTGAATSSFTATGIKNFERDGNKWVSFQVTDPVSGEAVTIQRPLVRTASIKRHGAPDQKRPVVTLKVGMGPISHTSEFTLTDRSRYEYPVLIGRTYLSGKAIVDVSRKYTQTPLKE